MTFRTLTKTDFNGPEFRELLWLAVEVEDAELTQIINEHLPQLSTVGIMDGDSLLGFVAYDPKASHLTIEYIATTPEQRGTGLGESLIRQIQHTHPAVDIYAETDDDAIGFYRRIGFVHHSAPRDPRWPDRARYACMLTSGTKLDPNDAL
jgi:ribosomal protein S18 acetylase RimI-like enzyme